MSQRQQANPSTGVHVTVRRLGVIGAFLTSIVAAVVLVLDVGVTLAPVVPVSLSQPRQALLSLRLVLGPLTDWSALVPQEPGGRCPHMH